MTTSRRPRTAGAELEQVDLRAAGVRAPVEGAEPDGQAAARPATPSGKAAKTPLYPRLLHLQHVHPNAWQRAALGEGAVGAGVLLAMADLASAWTIVALPVAVAAIVKAHDALQGLLERSAGPADR